jgi:aconitate hydratase
MTEPLTYRILRDHLVAGELVPGADVTVTVDQVLVEDATGTMAAMQFEMLGADEVAVPLSVLYTDHNVLQIDDKNMQDHRYLRSFAERYGMRFSPPGNGISHYLHLERFARPGEVLVGADSHSTMAGALGMVATGAGGLEVAVAMAGYGATIPCPRVIGVELVGELGPSVEAKDVILELLRRHGVRDGRGAVFEFFGEGVQRLSVTARGTIANMVVETGATGAMFPADEQTRAWLEAQGRADDFRRLDTGEADYDRLERIDLSALEPLVAVPHSPGNVVPVTEVAGTEVVQVCVGSSVNSSYEDLATVAGHLRDATVADGIQVTATPGSRQILDVVSRSGVYQDLLAAGVRVLEPICGPCIGIGQAPVRGKPSLRTFNRNFPGRSGTAEDQVYLCSPSTAAASALTGRITDPRTVEQPTLRPAAEPAPAVVDRHITAVLPAARRRRVEIERGPNLVAPAEPEPVADTVEGRVGIVVGDDISTGDMAPDGAIGMAVWSNIAACAEFMFRRLDPDFPERMHRWGGGLIVGGDNYGQGSSREHAALSAQFLGVRAVVAASYARIHRRNLIAVGVVPLELEDPADRERVEVGHRWRVEGVRAALRDGRAALAARTDAGPIPLRLSVSEEERAVLLAGGLLAHLRAGGRRRVQEPRP